MPYVPGCTVTFEFCLVFLLLAELSLGCRAGFFSVAASGAASLAAVFGLLIPVASLLAERGLWGPWAAAVAAPRL